MKKLVFILLAIILITTDALQAQQIEGRWQGMIKSVGQTIVIKTDFKQSKDSINGTLEFPQRNMTGLPLSKIVCNQQNIKFEYVVGPNNILRFEGNIEGDTIKGTILQRGIRGDFYLAKIKVSEEHTQLDTSTPSYKEEFVKFYNNNITISGTLTIPNNSISCPAVILISGSGSQNRDEDIFGFKVFRVLADYLSRHGIAVLRYDDRGVGGTSKGPDSVTSQDFSYDVEAAYNFLRTRAEINPKKIGLLGHSEGSMIAAMVGERIPEIAYIISLAGAAVKGENIVYKQVENQLRNSNRSEEVIQQNLRLQLMVFEAVRTGEGWDFVRNEMIAIQAKEFNEYPEEAKKSVKDPKLLIERMVDSKIQQAKLPWVKFFFTYDPSQAWEKIKCPVLALYGELDTQVPYKMNIQPLENALKKGGNTHYIIKTFPKANHLFQLANDGSVEEYALLEKRFIDGFLETLSEWFKEISKN